MKKVFLSTLMVLATVMMYAATPTTWDNVVTVKLTDGNNDTYQSRFGASPELTGEASWSAAPTNLEGATVRAYVTLGGVDYEQLFLNSMVNVALKVKTYNSTSLTIKLTANEGTTSLYDSETGTVTTVTKGGADATKEYMCTVTANTTIEDRFILFYVAPAAQAICFKYNKLELTKYDGATVEVFADGVATAAVSQVVPSDLPYEIDLSALASGKYKVAISGIATPEEYIIDVKPAVTVVP